VRNMNKGKRWGGIEHAKFFCPGKKHPFGDLPCALWIRAINSSLTENFKKRRAREGE